MRSASELKSHVLVFAFKLRPNSIHYWKQQFAAFVSFQNYTALEIVFQVFQSNSLLMAPLVARACFPISIIVIWFLQRSHDQIWQQKHRFYIRIKPYFTFTQIADFTIKRGNSVMNYGKKSRSELFWKFIHFGMGIGPLTWVVIQDCTQVCWTHLLNTFYFKKQYDIGGNY